MVTATTPGTISVGPLLRGWRQRRRLSQLDVSGRAAISTRHLSFLETGRGRAGRGVGPAPRRGRLLARLAREVTATGDPALAALYDELAALPGVSAREAPVPHGDGASRLMVTLRLTTPLGDLAFFSTVATFGTAVDITLAELSIESFFPADPVTAAALRAALP